MSKVIYEAGENITIIGESTRMCHAEESWREFALAMYPRVYKELGIPLLYVDEFSLRIENRCYAENHGHRAPSSLLKTDNDFITRLRESMPEEVVLYGEYAAVDVNARYIDCNISYYILDSIVDMIETESPAICINKFPEKARTLYTIYNRAYSTYRGKVLRIRHTAGARYYDAWNEKEPEVNVVDGVAEIFMEIGAMETGCIIAEKVEC